jgi:hypothetical protein
MQDESAIFHMGILVQVVDPVCIEKRRSPLDAMDFVSLSQQ